MSRSIYFDLESCAKPENELLELMPTEIANPVMPDELRSENNEVDFSSCPKYGGDAKKQEEWRVEKIKSTHAKLQKAREDWQMAALSAKAKFIGDAALHAERANVKLFSLREGNRTECFVVATKAEQEKILHEIDSFGEGVAFIFADTEKLLLKFFSEKSMEIGSAFKAKYCGFYIASFDLPFILRRQACLGIPVSRHLMRTPRYFDDDCYIDLHEAWTMGDKNCHVGGLKGLSKILGVTEKQGDGEGFGRLWQSDPCAAIRYHISEMAVIEEVAKKMGF